MKYAELRRRTKDAEERASRAEQQRAIAFRLLLGLAEERRCGHRVIAMESWPCPHPECTGARDRLLLHEASPMPLHYAVPDISEPLPPENIRTLARERVETDRGTVWMWRQA